MKSTISPAPLTSSPGSLRSIPLTTGAQQGTPVDLVPLPRIPFFISIQNSLQTLLPVLVFVVATVAGVSLYDGYAEIAPLRWNSISHDRNAHYLAGLRQATDLRNGDLLRFIRDLDANGRVWPPLHSVLLGEVLLVGGIDQRLAVLPSLTGWVGAIVFGFLLARRAAPRYGNVAGMTAAVFLFVSPAHRAYATDVMLESLGAMMTLVVLYAYVVWAQKGTRGSSIMFATALTILAFTKYNYWLLAVLAIGVSELCCRPRELTAFFAVERRTIDWRTWARSQWRRPLNYLLAGLIIVMAAVWISGGWTLDAAGLRVKMTSNMTLLTATFAIILVRLFGFWRAGGHQWAAEKLGHSGLALVHYHVVPMSIWLLFPQHLYWFIWYNSPANAGEAGVALGWRDTLDFYRQGVVGDYHLSVASALAVLVLAPMAVVVCARRAAISRGALVVALFALMSALLLLVHPNHKVRFLHTWLPVVWVAAGIGVAAAVEWIGRARIPGAGPLAAAAFLLSLCVGQREGFAQPGHATERGLHDLNGSWRQVTDSYLPELAGSQRVGIFSNMPVKFLAAWSYIERYGRADRLEIDLREVGNYAPATHEGFDRWVGKTTCDTVVYIDMNPDSSYAEPTPGETNEVVGEMLPAQCVFKLIRRIELPAYQCIVTVWKK
jgi:hypothetical protein